jgi:subfamily B ATP-binding cassette protein MsbA
MPALRDIPGYLKVFQSYIGWRMYSVFALTLLAALAEGLGIVMLLPLLDGLGGGGLSGGVDGEATKSHSNAASRLLSDLLDCLGLGGSTLAILLVIGAAFLLKALVRFAASAYSGYLQAQLMRELKARLFDAYSHMQYGYYAQRDIGHFINVINNQIQGLYKTFNRFLVLFANVINTAVYFGLAFFVAWRFGLMALAVGVTMLALFRWINMYVRDLSRCISRENGHLAKLLIQSLQAFKYLAATDQFSHLRGGVLASIRRITGYQLRQSLAEAFSGSVFEPVSIAFIIAIVIVQLEVLQQPLAPIMVSIVLFHRGMGTVTSIQNSLVRTLNSVGSVEMVRDEFIAQQRHREPDGQCELAPITQGIELRGLSFAYQPELGDVLRDISLSIPARTSVALVGESGAGKSTLVDLICLLLRPTRGEILIDGIPANAIRLASWRRQIGYVSQETVVFDDTLANNICLWQGDIDNNPALFERVRDAARRAHIAHFIEDLPDGYKALVGDRGVRLSGGQRQRLFIARELFKQPSLLILDEATSALDSQSERFIQQSIDALKGQITVVIIAHRLSTIRNVDQVYVFDQGRLVEQGAYAALRERPKSRFGQLVALQAI